MKWILLALMMAATVSAIEHDDLRILMLGYMEGLEIAEDHPTLLACVDDSISAAWDKSYWEVKNMTDDDWKSQAKTLLTFVSFINPTLNSLAMLIGCSTGEINTMNKRFKYWAEHPEELTTRAMNNLDLITDVLKDFAAQWDTATYTAAGKLAGGLVNMVFIKEGAIKA